MQFLHCGTASTPAIRGCLVSISKSISSATFSFRFDAFSRLWNLRNDTRLWIRSSALQKPQNSVVDCGGSRVSISGKRLLEYERADERNEIVMFCIISISNSCLPYLRRYFGQSAFQTRGKKCNNFFWLSLTVLLLSIARNFKICEHQ